MVVVWEGAFAVRKVRLSSSVHFFSTGRDGRTRSWASQTPARTPPEPDASGDIQEENIVIASNRLKQMFSRHMTLPNVLR